MIIGLLMLLGPVVVFAISLRYSRLLRPNLRKVYRMVGGLVVIICSGISFCFAAYTGDQGGIAAYFFQMLVIAVYLVFSMTLVLVNWLFNRNNSRVKDS